MFKKKTIATFEWIKLPEKLKDVVSQWHNFRNDVVLPLNSKFSPSDGQTWADTLTGYVINEYFLDQSTGDYPCGSKTLEDFIEEYGLQFEWWIVQQNFNLSGVEEIYIDICW